eukprot:8560055-Alexandrium_andersonii.AAC.1
MYVCFSRACLPVRLHICVLVCLAPAAAAAETPAVVVRPAFRGLAVDDAPGAPPVARLPQPPDGAALPSGSYVPP